MCGRCLLMESFSISVLGDDAEVDWAPFGKLERLRFLRRREDGQALVELALALPFILMPILFGVIDMGRAISLLPGTEFHRCSGSTSLRTRSDPGDWAV